MTEYNLIPQPCAVPAIRRKNHRMKFEIELFSQSLAFILINGTRRGFVAKVPTNPANKKWIGQLEGNKSELEVSGPDLHLLNFASVIYKYTDATKRKPPAVHIYC